MPGKTALALGSQLNGLWSANGERLGDLTETFGAILDEVLDEFSVRVHSGLDDRERRVHAAELKAQWLSLMRRGPDGAYVEQARRVREIEDRLGIDPRAHLASYAQLTHRIAEALESSRGREAALVVFSLLSVDLMVSMLVFEELTSAKAARVRLDAEVRSTRKLAETVALFNQAARSIACLRRNAQRSADGTHVISAAAEEMASTIQSITANAAAVADGAAASQGSTAEAHALARAADGVVRAAEGSATEMAACTERLAATARDVRKVVGIISRVADETKMLALNAAIEAARAGDAGRGFGVVASEIKNLAKSVSDATLGVSKLIDELGRVAADLQVRSNTTTRELSAGRTSLDALGVQLDAVVGQTSAVAAAVGEITELLAQQQQASADVARSISEIAQREEESSAIVCGIAAETRDANDRLTKDLTHFDVARSPRLLCEIAKIDHVLFTKRIADTLLGGASLRAVELADEHGCRLGRWYDSQRSAPVAALGPFGDIAAPHAQVHVSASRCLARFEAGDLDGAIEELQNMEGASKGVLAALGALGDALEISEALPPPRVVAVQEAHVR